jgi:hypothetical protein
MSKRGVQRDDFRQVKPTPEERADWFKTHVPAHHPPYRAEHIPCGKRMWYSGLGIGSHLRACPGKRPNFQEDQEWAELTGAEPW